jgi:hypothetical protein
MRLSALGLLAVLASGCSIHIVEQPAYPSYVAEAPPPVAVQHPRRRTVATHHEAARPEPNREPRPRPVASTRPEPRTTAKPSEEARVPYRVVAPERRRPHVIYGDHDHGGRGETTEPKEASVPREVLRADGKQTKRTSTRVAQAE